MTLQTLLSYRLCIQICRSLFQKSEQGASFS
jgi:hypothetical protein